MINHHKIQ